MRRQVQAEVRTSQVSRAIPRRRSGPHRPTPSGGTRSAALRALHQCYVELADSGRHLLQELLTDGPPVQWQHYPADDAFDAAGMYQWFYHSHSPEDRPGAVEHGHFHLFARTEALGEAPTSARERQFLARFGATPSPAGTRHLISMGLTPKGVPCSLFTVNSWVTGDQMLSAQTTLELLQSLRLDTGHRAIDRVIVAVMRLNDHALPALLRRRDATLLRHRDESTDVFSDLTVEELSSQRLAL